MSDIKQPGYTMYLLLDLVDLDRCVCSYSMCPGYSQAN